MSKIRLLTEAVASQVAAGEVVERPASVVKELVENSLDAGSRRIEVAVRRGGISLIRVVDDGSGMDRDDALLCLERHATSKIRTGTDLAIVSTMGFRGEALPSIASVSKFRLATRPKEAMAGTEIVVNGGKIQSVRDAGDAPGTTIEVRSLFFNLPARRKFLRTENTEASHIEHQLQVQALAHPEVAFVYQRDERLVFQLPPGAGLGDRVRDLYGQQLYRELLPVPATASEGTIQVTGFISQPGFARSNRSQQLCFVNGRAVENPAIHAGLREGYHTALMRGQYPVTFLFIQLPPGDVDVNVHPAKREVRFHRPSEIQSAVADAIRAALQEGKENWRGRMTGGPPAEVPTRDLEIPDHPPPGGNPDTTPDVPPRPPPEPELAIDPPRPAPSVPTSAFHPEPSVTRTDSDRLEPAAADRETPEPARHDFRILGLLGKLYLLLESAEGLVLLDQHAAHERILYEQMMRQMESQGAASQGLLFPVIVEFGPRESDWLRNHLETLQTMGVGLEPFGEGSFKVESLPAMVRLRDPRQFVRAVLDELMTAGRSASKLRLGEDVIAKTVCRHAVKAHDDLSRPEAVRLLEDLLACELPYCCPHGRPTMIQITYAELEKKFGRRT